MLRKGRKLFTPTSTRATSVTLTPPCVARHRAQISAHVSCAGVAIFRVGSITAELDQLPEFLFALGCECSRECTAELAFAAELALPELVSWRYDTSATMPEAGHEELLLEAIRRRYAYPRHVA